MPKLLRFFIAGCFSYGAYLGLTYIAFDIFFLPFWFSYALSLCVMFMINFLLSLRFTFRVQYDTTILFRYTLTLIIFSLLNYISTLGFTYIFGEQFWYIIVIFVTTCIFFLKFFCYDRFVFHGSKK